MNTNLKTSSISLAGLLIGLSFLITIGCQEAANGNNGQSESQPSTTNDEVKALVEQLELSDPSKRVAAIVKLTEHPDEVAYFYKPLSKMLFDKRLEPKLAAKRAFEVLGEQIVDLVGPDIKSDSDNTYVAACEVINSIGPPARKWIPVLIENLESDSPKRLLGSAYALIPMGDLVEPYVEKLKPILNHKDFQLQVFVCRIAVGMGPTAAPLAEDLVKLSKDGNLSARSYSSWALGAIGPLDDIDVPGLLLAKLDVWEHLERQRALKGLALLGKDAEVAVEKIRELTTNIKASVQPEAAFALWKITGNVDESVKLLIDLDKNMTHQFNALELLVEMGEHAKPAEDHFTKLLANPDESIQELAIQGLVNINCSNMAVIEQIQNIADENPDPLLRSVATNAIKKLSGE